MRTLADGGSDTVTNAIAVCSNCHMELHDGNEKISHIQLNLYANSKTCL
jgi:5-methylcytosine-specific restriction protein A